MAPELVSVDESKGNDEDQYDEKIDIWAIGVIGYYLMNDGTFPFPGKKKAVVEDLILNSEPKWDITGDEELIKFLQKCLTKDRYKRPSAQDLLKSHSEMFSIASPGPENVTKSQVERQFKAGLASVAKANKFQRAISSFISNIIAKQKDLRAVRTLFNKVDTNNDGVIEFDELEAAMPDLTDLFNASSANVKEIFESIDTNGS